MTSELDEKNEREDETTTTTTTKGTLPLTGLCPPTHCTESSWAGVWQNTETLTPEGSAAPQLCFILQQKSLLRFLPRNSPCGRMQRDGDKALTLPYHKDSGSWAMYLQEFFRNTVLVMNLKNLSA